jgi:NAD(P)-dependent dehydrogenase (short-subunit alcohol dehydrogenase family)
MVDRFGREQMPAIERYRLTDRVAVVTGGAGLLGVEHAHALLEAGAHVVLTDINDAAVQQAATALADEFGRRVGGIRMDVTEPASIAAALRTILEQYGRVDVLVNNAAVDAKVSATGAGHEMSRFEWFSTEQWDREIAVGLTGTFLCCQVFGAHMTAQRSGVVLNIASDLSVFAPDQRLYRRDSVPDAEQPVKPVTYSVIKTALVGLTRYLATYWADSGVRVNALSPGGVRVDQPDAFVARLSQLIPLGRMAARDEYRAAVQFLCSDASGYMTGQNVVMDGGRSAW